MKKLLCIVLCLMLAATAFTGCSAAGKTVLTVGRAKVDSEIFAYYFDVYMQKVLIFCT